MNPFNPLKNPLTGFIVTTTCIILLLLASACSAPVTETDPAPATPSVQAAPPGASQSIDPTATTALAAETEAPAATLPPATLTASATPQPQSYQVRLHPDGGLYSGDQVSFEVIAPQGVDLDGKTITATLPLPAGEQTATASFSHFGIGARLQAVFLWAWDTSDLPAGQYPVTFSLPDGLAWSETITLQPRAQLPPPEPQAQWSTARSECCVVHYVTNTAAQRDLDSLLDLLDQQAEDAVQRMGTNLDRPISIVLLPRVLGHGGFASNEISVSYLDRDYMGSHPAIVLHHEIIHILDGQLGGDYRPAALIEGLATYQSGGHFKPEPLPERAAALLPPEPGCRPWLPDQAQATNGPGAAGSAAEGCGVNQYVPLRDLFDNFYFEQHEVGYVEAAALIQYMVESWGYPAYSAFYRDIQPPRGDAKPTQVIEPALQKHFKINLEQLETGFQDYLRRRQVTPAIAEDLRLSLAFFDTSRRYQQILDPSAYFLTAWLLDNQKMREKGIVADYARHPRQPENLALETMLEAADAALTQGDYAQAGRLLEAANAVLDAYPGQGLQAFGAHPLAADYLALVQTALASGYEPQRIRLENATARLWVSQDGPQLQELTLTRQPSGWSLLSN